MSGLDLPTIQRLADLYNQLSQRLTTLAIDLVAFQTTHDAMQTSLDNVNQILDQLNLPLVSIPVQVDPAWVSAISDAASRIGKSTEDLRAATHKTGG